MPKQTVPGQAVPDAKFPESAFKCSAVGSAPRDLAEVRRDIDAVDNVLLDLLNRRAVLSLEVGRLKAGRPDMPVFDPKREQELVSALIRRNTGVLCEEHIRTVWESIFKVSRSLQTSGK